ncbi:MAG TPA: S8 family serine peptidase [Candidatus Didemnitutus sp.]|nr:S8 family serine peptidase [Candidatus Didemnitutus sp.]
MRFLVSVIVWLSVVQVGSAQLSYLPADPPYRPDPVVSGMIKVRLTPEGALSAEATLASLGLRIVRPLLPFEQSVTFREREDGSFRMQPLKRDRVLEIESKLLRSYVVTYNNPAITPERMIAMLHVGCGPIDCAAPWCVMELAGEPNDPQRDRQALLQTISIFDAWDVESGSDTVVIGISDSGLRQDHEDLRSVLYERKGELPDNELDDDGNGYVDDNRGYNLCAVDGDTSFGNTFNPNNNHGTGVGGICGAAVNNNIGISGIARNCRLFPLRTMPDNSTGIVYGYESIMYCALNEIDVVNCSWGGQSPSCIDEDVVAYAIARGTAVVAAAGNHGSASPFYPASYDGVLSVGVVDPADNVISMSGHGPLVDVMAPGHDSWTTDNDGLYFGFCCTSGSAPIASALVALVRSKHPTLDPLEACAMVRESVDERPWKDIPVSVDSLLLPRGRVNALLAVTNSPDSVVSIVLDTVAFRAASGAQRWTVGDTVLATVSMTNSLAPWTISQRSNVALAGTSLPGVRPVTTSTELGIEAKRGEDIALTPLSFVVERQTDTAAYAVLDLIGFDVNDVPVDRRFSFSITPSPAFTTLYNQRMLVSIGDRGRIGNTDIQRGQGAGLTYGQFCGQLYEGGLMVYANNRVVDAVRAKRGVNDHFLPVKRFVTPDEHRGIVRDDDAPDSLKIGVEVELHIELDSSASLLIIDATVTNTSMQTLHDLTVAWFYDWDLGTQPSKNSTWLAGDGSQIVASTKGLEPVVVLRTASRYQDARPVHCGLDNTTTYGGFTTEMKLKIFEDPDSVQYGAENDVSVIVGMRFVSPVPPGHRRSFRHVVAIDTTIENAMEIASKGDTQALPVDTLFVSGGTLVFPNPTASVLYVPVENVAFGAAEFTIHNALGQVVQQLSLHDISSAFIQPIDVSYLASGTYEIRYSDDLQLRSWPFVVVR